MVISLISCTKLFFNDNFILLNKKFEVSILFRAYPSVNRFTYIGRAVIYWSFGISIYP